jgi:methylmalonyl-CoA/ethylmalonyl-CoA epimerase
MSWSIQGINHVGLAPKDPAKAKWFLGELLGLAHLGDELVGSQKTLTSMFHHDSSKAHTTKPDQGQRLEILEPAPSGQGPIASFLEKKGSGIHHIALTVDNLDDLLSHLKGKSVRMIDETPREGAHRTRIAFVHPEATGGLLIEFVEESK